MRRPFLLLILACLALVSIPGQAAAQCYICQCNEQNASCTLACQAYTSFSSQQQCEFSCQKQNSTCMDLAYKYQQDLDAAYRTRYSSSSQ